jgi:hypothetical protein
MAMIKLFGDRYYNLERIDVFLIEPEDDDEDVGVWNVYANSHEGESRTQQWMGQFETKEDACKAVEELMSKIGIQVIEFIPDLN